MRTARLDPTPTKLDGSESSDFEAQDLEQAEDASEAVQDYCSGAVSVDLTRSGRQVQSVAKTEFPAERIYRVGRDSQLVPVTLRA